MAELKSTEYKSDLQKVTEELAELKRKYLEEKKANRSRHTALDLNDKERPAPARGNGAGGEVRFTGGGFRMSVQQITTK